MELNSLLLSVSDNTLNKLLKSIGGATEKVIGGVYGTFGKIPRLN